MDTSNWRLTQGGSAGGGDSSMESGDWRSQLQADSRQGTVNKITDILKRHLPYSGYEGLQKLNKIAVRFEEKIYSAATSQSDYLRKISLKMLNMGNRSQNSMRDGMQSYSTANRVNPSDSGLKSIIKPEMDTSNWRPTEGGSAGGGDSSMESGDWRSQLQADSRQRIVNKITDTLKRHLPFSGHEGLQELNKIAMSFEEKIYSAATSQSDYLRKISLKMLTIETRSQNPMRDGMQSYSTANSVNPSDPGLESIIKQEMDTSNWRPIHGGSAGGGDSSMESGDWRRSQLQADFRQSIMDKIMDTLKRHVPYSGDEGLKELNAIAVRFEGKIYSGATSQSDYLRKISLKMLSMETRSQNPM